MDENGDFDSSDSGIGQPKNGQPGARGTIRPAGRAARRAASSMGGSINGVNMNGQPDPYGGRGPNQMKVDPYAGANQARSRIPSAQGSMRKGGSERGFQMPVISNANGYNPTMEAGKPVIGPDGIPRMGQADDVEDFSHFQNFVDDDTPAPEASIPVPRVFKRHQNYLYQTFYAMYCVALMAYIYVRLTFTLDAPGLNRIYCTVVACLEIITCPSLLIQGKFWQK